MSYHVHLIGRERCENFFNLLKLAGVILHPFPLDGSRTSADALIVDVSYVTMPSEYLRGRMRFAVFENDQYARVSRGGSE